MFEFWETLTYLISHYTVADTAYVWAIIESVATLATAAGAFIAVIVSIRIAKNQNALFVEQNKISAAQVEITKQQNHISLFNERNMVREYFLSFFSSWEGLPIMLSGIKTSLELLDLMYYLYYLSSVERSETNNPQMNIDDIGSIRRLQTSFFKQNASAFGKLMILFDFSDEQMEYIRQIKYEFSLLLLAIFILLKTNQPPNKLLHDQSNLFAASITAHSIEIMRRVEDQIHLVGK